MSGYRGSASLSSALLANKGAAAPMGSVTALLNNLPCDSRPTPAETPVSRKPETSLGARQPAVLSSKPPRRKPTRATHTGPTHAGPVKANARAKLSLRLDPERHLRLKLAAAHLRRSSQTIMLEALDAYLARIAPVIGDGECACMAERETGIFGDGV